MLYLSVCIGCVTASRSSHIRSHLPTTLCSEYIYFFKHRLLLSKYRLPHCSHCNCVHLNRSVRLKGVRSSFAISLHNTITITIEGGTMSTNAAADLQKFANKYGAQGNHYQSASSTIQST